ncbi:MAG: N-acetylmuramoyl-L-alanine amidase [Muribaculaceae bacterium]|nr:N-acetylmuramoyl-L-alanine amidase [Muribaculaceae bacterium]
MKRSFLFIIIMLLVCSLSSDGATRRKKTSAKKTAKTTKVVKATPRTKGPFIVRRDAPEAPDGLQGDVIALWQSHGRYWDAKEGRWTWQRSRLMGTVEDLFPQAFVIPYLIPMLEDAGAYVITPRERDLTDVEVIVDADGMLAQKGYTEKDGKQKWQTPQGVSGFAYKNKILTGTENPFKAGSIREASTVTNPSDASSATWNANIPKAGEYALYVSYASLPNSAPDARYLVTSLRGEEEIQVNQTMGGGTWIYLGTFPFAKGQQPVVKLTNLSTHEGKVVTADAVRIGGGMGNVSRGGTLSGFPRWGEGARYWMQWAGVPSSVYSVSDGTNDYEDDFKGRGAWVNYMAGGSENLPGVSGLGIPVDLSFAFHTDAGTTSDPYTTIGTLPIVSTSGQPFTNGRSRQTSKRYAEIVTDQVVADIQALHDPGWNQRKLRDKAYHEAREPRVPAMLIELMSHQNFADMRMGLDPQFRFDVSRAIYKGMLKYLHEIQGTPYVVTPLPVKDLAISGKNGVYTLTWHPTPDPLEKTAVAKYYIVYERVDSGVFTELAVTDDPRISVRPADDRIYSYKVVAANNGGISFPSETLALCNMGDDSNNVTIVNGFTRISGPTQVWRDGEAGFDYADDHGVPYIRDIHFTGEQTEFRTSQKWISNDAPGHGSSRATHETEIIAGNTFDFVYTHGVAIRAAGHGFVSSSLGAFLESVPSTKVIDLILGKQKEITVGTTSQTRFKPFTPELKQRLTEFCDAGGSLLVSGSYIGQDLFDNPLSTPTVAQDDRRFAHNILGMEWRQAKATATGGVVEVGGAFKEFTPGLKLSFRQQPNAECYAVESPESFVASSSSEGMPILRYTENDFVAGTASALTTHRVVVMGFPFETIAGANARDRLMSDILSFLTASPSLHLRSRVTVYPETILGTNDDDTLTATNWDGDTWGAVPRDQATMTEEPKPRRKKEHES